MEENLVKRIQPQNIDAEKTVVGSMILDNECIPVMEGILTAADFYYRQYGALFEAATELYDEGKPVDLLTLQDRLQAKDVPPEIAGPDFLGDLIAAVPLSSNAKYYAEIVYEKSMLRQLIHTTEGIANDCYVGKERMDTILQNTEKQIFGLLNQKKTSDFEPIQQITLKALAKINEASKNKNPVTGIPMGFADLDTMLTGMHRSDFILIAARPSMGKTALALNIMQYVTTKKDYSAAIFSLEMSKELLMNRLLAMDAKVEAQSIRTGNLTDDDWDKLIESANIIGSSKLIIDDTPGISVGELRSRCRKYKLEFGLDVIFIDYLQLMSGGGRAESRQQEVADISRSLKALAREMDAPVIALSQLSRAPEQRPDHRPVLSDLRESGSIEQDADVVMFLYRDDYYNKETAVKNVTEVIVAKQRNGPLGTVELAWLPQYTKFGNLDKAQQRKKNMED